MYPVFIACRDRVTTLVGLIGWLEQAGLEEIYLIDNASTWPALLDFYETTEHTVIRTGGNHGHKVGWDLGIIREFTKGRRFIYTDPDVRPAEDCPPDAVDRMADVLDRTTNAVKVGFSIKVDDIPAFNRSAIDNEAAFWSRWDSRAEAWRAPIDTTFALYRQHEVYRHRFSAYRLPAPYSVRHLPWYTHPAELSDEEAYYVAHADPQVSNWTRDVIEAR